MKDKFYNDLKNYLLNYEKDNLQILMRYYETMYQNANKLTEVIEDYCKYTSNFTYYDNKLHIHMYTKDRDAIDFWDSQIEHYYKITFYDISDHLGYCTCNETDNLYDKDKKCCGIECDWSKPSISVEKIYPILDVSFEGLERDLWELEDKWKEHLKEHKKQRLEADLDRLNKIIEDYEKERIRMIEKLSETE